LKTIAKKTYKFNNDLSNNRVLWVFSRYPDPVD